MTKQEAQETLEKIQALQSEIATLLGDLNEAGYVVIGEKVFSRYGGDNEQK